MLKIMTSKIILISGPPCSGKTFLINNIENSLISNQIQNEFEVVNANQLRLAPELPKSQTIIHYDCYRNFKRGLEFNKSEDPFLYLLLENIAVTDTVIILNPIKILVQRLKKRIQYLSVNITKERLEKLEKLLTLYRNPETFLVEYLKWYDFLISNNFQNIMLNLNGFEGKDKIIEAKRCVIESIILKQSYDNLS